MFLASIFSLLCSTNFNTTKHSYDFAYKLSNFNPVNCSMLSLNAKSLFTNVPINGAFYCLKVRLCDYSDFEIEELIMLTKLCISKATCEFNDKFYKQSEIFSMSNRLSHILLNIYNHYFEENLLKLLNFTCWMSYVDDIFVLAETPLYVTTFLEIVNKKDPQFIFELENDSKLPFLDVLIIRYDSFFVSNHSSCPLESFFYQNLL